VTRYTVGALRPEDRDEIYRFLSEDAYWSLGMPRDVFDRAIANSLSFVARTVGNPSRTGTSRGGEVAGYARVVTDKATWAWLCDVFVLPAHRGKGVSKLLMDAVIAHPELQGLRNFVLATRDAHGLYAKYGFTPLAEPERWMAIRKPYRQTHQRYVGTASEFDSARI
jgi:GNAT superfamily N-acetyltransferase